ncbi:hypothetical protein F4808DRAFT_424065 [Astrocystis sublimbata]|nr:hypothetical protein F4808DRAFT_424065 [Astrocystis sublimbata]
MRRANRSLDNAVLSVFFLLCMICLASTSRLGRVCVLGWLSRAQCPVVHGSGSVVHRAWPHRPWARQEFPAVESGRRAHITGGGSGWLHPAMISTLATHVATLPLPLSVLASGVRPL